MAKAKTEEPATNVTGMMSFLERIDRLEEERKSLGEDIKDIWAEAKSAGYELKALRKAHSLSKMKKEDLVLVGVYADAMSLFE